MAQFNHCPLIWMCQNRTYNNEINRLDERCLQLICTDTRSSLETLMEKDYSVSMHTKNLQALATKMFQVHTKHPPERMQEVFLWLRNNKIIICEIKEIWKFFRLKV